MPISLAATLELLLRDSKSFDPSVPIAYASSVSPPDEAVAWPGAQVLGAGGCCRLAGDAGVGCWMMLFPAKGAGIGWQMLLLPAQGAGIGWQMMLLVVRGAVPANHRAHESLF